MASLIPSSIELVKTSLCTPSWLDDGIKVEAPLPIKMLPAPYARKFMGADTSGTFNEGLEATLKYTDGSSNQSGGSYAFVLISQEYANVEKKFKSKHFCSVFQLELQVVVEAMK